MTAIESPDIVVVVNPLSSGPYVVQAFQESGVRTAHLYQRSLLEAMRRDETSACVLEHESVTETLRALERLRPLAVVPGSESAVLLADDLSRHLGLPHNVPELAAARRDKDLMLAAVARAGVPVAASFAVECEEELRSCLGKLDGFPVVVKPKNSAGSDGLKICRTVEDALCAFAAIDSRTNIVGVRNVGALVQEYVDGTQYMVNTVSIGGRHVVTDYYEQRIDLLPDRSISRHLKSRLWLNPVDEQVVAYGLACLDALGVREGAAHAEVRMTRQGPRLIEVNVRLMGPIMEPDPYHVAFGYSPQHLLAERYLRPDSFADRIGRPYAAHQVLARSYLRPGQSGTVQRVRNVSSLRTLPAFHSVHGIPRPGDRINDAFLTTAQSGVAYFVGSDETVSQSLDRLHELEDQKIFFDIDPDD